MKICFLAPSSYGKSTAIKLLQKHFDIKNIRIAEPLYELQSDFYFVFISGQRPVSEDIRARMQNEERASARHVRDQVVRRPAAPDVEGRMVRIRADCDHIAELETLKRIRPAADADFLAGCHVHDVKAGPASECFRRRDLHGEWDLIRRVVHDVRLPVVFIRAELNRLPDIDRERKLKSTLTAFSLLRTLNIF